MCDVAKGLKSLEEKSSGNTSQLASLYPPVGRDLGSGIFIFGRQYVHWSHCLCSKEYPQKVPSPPRGRRGLRLTKCREVGGEGGMKQPFSGRLHYFTVNRSNELRLTNELPLRGG